MDKPAEEQYDPGWFREPNRRERWIAAGLFVGFGIFFVALFFVLAGWWFRWVILSLAAISIFNGMSHALGTRRARQEHT